MSNNIRQNFYQGQNVLAKNLNNLQDYSDKNRNILISELLGTGILKGLEVTHKKDLTFSVREGVAFDKNGNRLILEKPTDITLNPSTNVTAELILIGIKHSYLESEPVKDSVNKETPTILTPSVELVVGKTLASDVFQLASIALNEGTDPLIVMSGIFIPLPAITTTVSNNKTEIDNKVNTLSGTVGKNKTDITTLQQKTSVFTTVNNKTTIQSHILNLITQNLQINGLSYMETGANAGGHYVKFANGLLICYSTISWTTGRYGNTALWVLPMSYKSSDYRVFTQLYTHTSQQVSYNISITTGQHDATFRVAGQVSVYSASDKFYVFTIGFWK